RGTAAGVRGQSARRRGRRLGQRGGGPTLAPWPARGGGPALGGAAGERARAVQPRHGGPVPRPAGRRPHGAAAGRRPTPRVERLAPPRPVVPRPGRRLTVTRRIVLT